MNIKDIAIPSSWMVNPRPGDQVYTWSTDMKATVAD